MTPNGASLSVMQFVTVFECGGTERQFLNLGVALHERQHRVRFGCIRQSGRLLGELEARHIPVAEYRMRSFYSGRFLSQQLALARDLVRDGVQVLHAYNLYGNVFAVPAARLARVPVVIAAIRDSGVYLNDWTRRVQRVACRMADHVLVNAEAIKDWLVSDGYRGDRISVIRNGIDLSRFLDPAACEADVRADLHLPADTPVISTVARLCPSKGLDDVVEAMSVVQHRHPRARLVIVGEGLSARDGEIRPDYTYRDALRRRAAELGVGERVIFTGYRGDVPAILHQATLAVQPSLTEGLSNSVLESMASGAAVVATPVGGTPEIMAHDRTGWLVPPKDPRGLGDAICTLLDDDARRRRLGAAARAFVRGAFSIDEMVSKTENIYRTLLRDARRGGSRAARAA